jgi:glycosyltransferase involved in cell wall biosynthesis
VPSRRDYSRRRILYVGADAQRKGLDILMAAMTILRSDRQDTKLVVVGTDCDAVDGVERHGFLDWSDASQFRRIHDIYESCTVAALPSRFEPVGCVYLEAMSFGLPIVAPPQFAGSEFIVEGVTGMFCDQTPAGVADAICKCLATPEITSKMGRSARSHQQQAFRWGHVVERITTTMPTGDAA